jgi:hypothetical protein
MSGLNLRDLPAEAVEKLKPLRGHDFDMPAIDAAHLREADVTAPFPTDPLEALQRRLGGAETGGHRAGAAAPVGRRGQVMSRLAPILADDKDAAALLSMKPADFRALVEAGHLPKGKEIAPGFTRWDVDQLRRLAKGDAVDGLGAVEW